MTARVAFVAADLPFGVAANALAHVALGFATLGAPSGSEPAPIVLTANSRLATLRRQARAAGAAVVDFTAGMTGETWVEQLARMAALPEAEQRYYALAIAGPAPLIESLVAQADAEAAA